MQKTVVYKEIVDSEVAEAIRRCSVNLNGGEARRFVRRHTVLTKAVSYDPHTYVEVTLTIPSSEMLVSADGDVERKWKTTLWMPGFAQCMHSDKFDVTVGILQACFKAYEDLVSIVEKFRCEPSRCVEKKKSPKPAVPSQEDLRKRLKAKLAERRGGMTIHEGLVRFVDTWTQAGDEIRRGLAVAQELMSSRADCEERLEETEDLLAICERADEPAVEFEEAVNAIEGTESDHGPQ
jgi:hypothetical protein